MHVSRLKIWTHNGDEITTFHERHDCTNEMALSERTRNIPTIQLTF